MNEIINGKIIAMNNGACGFQPEIVVLGDNSVYYLITATPERKFLVSIINNINLDI